MSFLSMCSSADVRPVRTAADLPIGPKEALPHSQGALGALRQSQFSDHSRSACRMATGASWTDARWPTARTLRFARSWWCRARPRARRLLAGPILARPWRPSSTPCQVHNSSILPLMHLVAKGGIFTNSKI